MPFIPQRRPLVASYRRCRGVLDGASPLFARNRDLYVRTWYPNYEFRLSVRATGLTAPPLVRLAGRARREWRHSPRRRGWGSRPTPRALEHEDAKARAEFCLLAARTQHQRVHVHY